MATKTIPFKVYSYDLWGNAKDGWEVNDIYPHSSIEIPETVLQENDLTLLTWLKRHGPISKNAKRQRWQVDGGDQPAGIPRIFYFNYQGKPTFEIREIEPEDGE